MTPTRAIEPTPCCLLTLAQVDDLHDQAHRILLYGELVANTLESQSYAVKDQILEGLLELVVMTITHAQKIEDLLAQGCRAAANGGEA